MLLVSPAVLVRRAYAEGYAVPAFNLHSLDMVTTLVAVAEEERAPVILQASPATVAQTGWRALVAVVAEAAAQASVPVALHLDHAHEPVLAYQAIHHGFTGVMLDGSALPFEENVALTRRVVEVAHAAGVAVEGEIGHVPRHGRPAEEDPDTVLTRPEDAEAFAAATGVDMLAVAVGNVHGLLDGQLALDLERLAAIRDRVGVPLVLHGGSGVPDRVLGQAVRLGVAKVNVATELKRAWCDGLRAALAEPGDPDPRRVVAAARAALAAAARARIRALGAAGRA